MIEKKQATFSIEGRLLVPISISLLIPLSIRLLLAQTVPLYHDLLLPFASILLALGQKEDKQLLDSR